MTEVEVVIDTQNYEVQIGKLVHGLSVAMPRIIEKSAEIIQTEMIKSVPVKTGKLRDSITKTVNADNAVVSTNSGYGKYVDEDTKPHMIYGNPFLRFEKNGQIIIRRKVFHPGTKGHHFRITTLENSQVPLRSAINQILNEVLN